MDTFKKTVFQALLLPAFLACAAPSQPENTATADTAAAPGTETVAQPVASPQENIKVKLKGKFLSPDQNRKAYLFQLVNGTREEFLAFEPAPDGTFNQIFAVPEPGFYVLVYNKQENILVLTGGDIEVLMDGSKPDGKFEVKGSPDTDYFYEYTKIEERVNAKFNALREKYFAATDKKQAESEYNSYVQEAVKEVKNFILKTNGSIVSILPANMLDPNEETEFLERMTAVLMAKYPTSGAVKGYATQLAALKATAIGQPAPEISLPSPEGQPVALSSLRGKYVLIDFWASWCGPCRKENPNVVKLYEQHKGKDFEIYGVSLDRDRNAWLEAIRKDGLKWVHVSDLKFWQSGVVPLYRIEGIPMTVLVDKNGVIIAKNLRGEALAEKLSEIL